MRTVQNFIFGRNVEALILTAAGFLAVSGWAQPANDNFDSAQVLTGMWGSVTNDNSDATAEPGEPSHAGIVPTASLWYKWTAPEDGEVEMDTFGSYSDLIQFQVDTVHAVYAGNSLTTLRQVAATDNLLPAERYNDTWPGFYSLVPQIGNWGPGVLRFNAKKGTTYYIAVDGNFSGNGWPFGSIVLNWAFQPAGVFRFASEEFDYTTLCPLYHCTEYESWAQGGGDGTMFQTYYRYAATGLVVTVTRVAGSSGRMLVDFNTTDWTRDYDTNQEMLATAGMDYLPVSTTLVFDDFEMSKSVLLQIMPSRPTIDNPFLAQTNRIFGVTLSNARRDPTESPEVSDPIIDPLGGTVKVTILDLDSDPYFWSNFAPPDTNNPDAGPLWVGPTNAIFNFYVEHMRVPEDVNDYWGGCHIHVGRFGTNREAVTINYVINNYGSLYRDIDDDDNDRFPLAAASDYATPEPPISTWIWGTNSDFFITKGTLSWGQNDFLNKTITFTVTNDFFTEFNEDFHITLYRHLDNPSRNEFIGTANEGSVTILFDDRDPPAGSVDEYHCIDYGLQMAPPTNTIPPDLDHPGTDGVVYNLAVQPDGRTVLAGNFVSYNTIPRNCIARTEIDGTLDSSFDPGSGADNFISSLALTSGGQIYIGGGFTSYNGQQRNSVARLNSNGSLDASFNPEVGADNSIWAMALQPDGKLIVAGEFNSFNLVTRKHIARLNANGTLDTTFNPGANGPDGTIWAVALQPDGKILIGGEFTTISGNSRRSIARLNANGSLDTSFDPGSGTDGIVYALGLRADGKIWIGGEFKLVNGVSRPRFARLNPNGSLDTSFDPGTGANDTVYSIALQTDGTAYVSGMFTAFNGTHRMGITRLYDDGTVDTGWLDTSYNQFAGLHRGRYADPAGIIFTSSVLPDGNVMIGGSFSQVGGGQASANTRFDPDYPADQYNVGVWLEPKSRDGIRNRSNIARLIGGSTPGPGNIGFTYNAYNINKGQSFLSVALTRTNGTLGYLSGNFYVDSGLAQSGVDYIYNGLNPVYLSSWNAYLLDLRPSVGDVETRMLSDGLFGANTVPVDIFGHYWYYYNFGQINVSILNSSTSGNLDTQLRLANPSGADQFFLGGANIPLGGALGKSTVPFTIVDDNHDYGTLSFSTDNFYVSEATNATITVLRSGGTFNSVSVRYATSDGTALAGTDYVGTSGTLNFGNNQTSKTFTVQIVNNALVQPPDRTVNLRLYTPGGGAKLGLTNAVLSIVDDDYTPGYVNFSSASYSTNESSGAAIIPVSRTGGSRGTLVVRYATTDGTAISGIKYIGVTNTIQWDDGDVAVKYVTVPIIHDGNVGSNTAFTIRLTDAWVNTTNAPQVLGGSVTLSTVNIIDDDAYGTLQFSAPTYSVNENGGYATITVTRLAGSAQAISVGYSTADGTAVSSGVLPNYVATSGTLNFAAGEVAKSFNIPIQPDGLSDISPFFFTVNLSNASPASVMGSLTSATVYLVDTESFNMPAGSLDPTFNPVPGFNGDIYAVGLQADGKILAGGSFTEVSYFNRNRIIRLNADATVDDTFLSGLSGANGPVHALLVQSDSRALIGGAFTTVDGVNRGHLARLVGDGRIDTSFNPGSGANNTVFALAETFSGVDRRLLIGGAFTTFNGSPRAGLTRLLNDGSLDRTFSSTLSINGTVYAIAVYPTNSVQAGKILIGGDFTLVDDAPHNGIARLNPDGTLDSTFDAGDGASDAVRALAIQLDGRVVVGGSFTNFAGVALNHLARLNVNGAVDSTFLSGVGANDTVDAILIQPDTRILVAGAFTRANGVTRGRITRLLPNGTVDPWINFGEGANSFISAMVLQPDGMILLGGGFSQYDGTARKGLARIYGGSISGSGSFQFSTGQFVADENSTNALITVRRRGGTYGNMTVNFATSPGSAVPGVNYSNVTATLQFPVGETFTTVRVPVMDDLQITPDLTVNLALSSPLPPSGLGDQPTAVLNIANDDSTVTFAAANWIRAENASDGAATIHLTRQGSTRQFASVEFMTTTNGTAMAGTNYVPVTNTVNFLPGVNDAAVKVPVLYDPIANGDVTVEMILTNSVNALLTSPSVATLNILDVDQAPGQLLFSATNYFVSEGAGYLEVTILRTNGHTGVVTVNLATQPGTATPGLKYGATNSVLTFNDNEVLKTFRVSIIQETQVEGDQTFSLALSNPTGGATILAPRTVLVTILDDDLGVGFTSPAYVISETAGSVALNVFRQNGTNLVTTVQYATTNVTATAGTNYQAVSGTLVFTNGEVLKSFSVPILHDPRVTGDLSFGVNLLNPMPPAQLITPSSAAVVILDSDPGLCFSNSIFGVLKSSNSVTISVVRSNANTGTVGVSYATTNDTAIAGVDYTASSGTLVFSNGVDQQTFQVPIINNRLAQGDKIFNIGLFNPTNGAQVIQPAMASVVITDDISGLRFSAPAYAVNENGVRSLITVQRTGYTNSTVAVDYYTSDGTGRAGVNYLAANGTLVFTNGETSKAFYVTNIDNSVVDGDHTVVLGLRNQVGNAVIVTPSVTLTIIESDGSLIVPAGSSLLSESGPVNGSIDPGETVTMLLALRNATGTNTANLVATLVATNGVTNPSGPQTYGALTVHGPSVYKPFSFTASGTNGQPLAVTLALNDGLASYSNAVFSFYIGNPPSVFSNTAPIVINDRTNASPYPSTINVSGLGGVVTKATVTLTNFTHTWPSDVDVLLVAPTGERSFLMAKAGGSSSVTNVTITFDQLASSALPQTGPLVSGTNRPASYAGAVPPFQAPAPPPPYDTNLNAFIGVTPNGNWSLYVVDDASFNRGGISNGWILRLNTGVPSSSDVGLTMSAAPAGEVILGNPVSYTLVVSNYGPANASNIVVSDALPTAATYVGSTPSQGVVATNGGVVSWTIPSLLVGNSATLALTMRPGQLGAFVNAATVATGTVDLNPDDDSASLTNTVVVPTADLTMAMVAQPNQLNFGGNVGYTIMVTNLGPAIASAVSVSDELPAGLQFVSASPAGYIVSGRTITFPNLGNVAVGGQATASIVAKAVASGDITNTATCVSIVTDPAKFNNFASVKVSVTPPPVPPPVRLGLQFVPPLAPGGEITLVWPVEPIGWVPEQATTVNPPGGWTTTIVGAIGTPFVNGANYNLRVQVGAGEQFFRLRWISP